MKTSLSHLPEKKQEELKMLVEHTLAEVPDTQFIILFGSYARGKYVDYDQRTEFGLRTTFQSDYDILLLTPKKKVSRYVVLRRLKNVRAKYMEGYHYSMVTPAHFIPMSVEEFNKCIEEGRYFYTDIVKEGIVLYDSGEYQIEPIRKLDYEQIHKLSEEYYNEKYGRAESFFEQARFAYSREDYKMASFELHQAVENYLLAIILSASLYVPKCHNIIEILDESKMFTPKAVLSFPSDTPEDERLLNLLADSYVQSRYNKDFIVTKEDIDELFRRAEKLRTDAKEVCLSKIDDHKQKITTN